jgi:hypothetical protein
LTKTANVVIEAEICEELGLNSATRSIRSQSVVEKKLARRNKSGVSCSPELSCEPGSRKDIQAATPKPPTSSAGTLINPSRRAVHHMALVPVCSPTGKILQHLDADFAATLKGVDLIRATRRGPVVRVYLRPMPAGAAIGRTGTAFRQELPSGWCFALRGVEGSR